MLVLNKGHSNCSLSRKQRLWCRSTRAGMRSPGQIDPLASPTNYFPVMPRKNNFECWGVWEPIRQSLSTYLFCLLPITVSKIDTECPFILQFVSISCLLRQIISSHFGLRFSYWCKLGSALSPEIGMRKRTIKIGIVCIKRELRRSLFFAVL